MVKRFLLTSILTSKSWRYIVSRVEFFAFQKVTTNQQNQRKLYQTMFFYYVHHSLAQLYYWSAAIKMLFFIHFSRKSRCVHVVEFLCNKERIIDWQSVYKNKQTVFENTQMKCAWLCDAWDNKIHRLLVFDHKSQYGIFRLFTMYIIVA